MFPRWTGFPPGRQETLKEQLKANPASSHMPSWEADEEAAEVTRIYFREGSWILGCANEVRWGACLDSLRMSVDRGCFKPNLGSCLFIALASSGMRNKEVCMTCILCGSRFNCCGQGTTCSSSSSASSSFPIFPFSLSNFLFSAFYILYFQFLFVRARNLPASRARSQNTYFNTYNVHHIREWWLI